MLRLYGMFRRNLDDVDAASAYFIAIVAGPQELPLKVETMRPDEDDFPRPGTAKLAELPNERD